MIVAIISLAVLALVELVLIWRQSTTILRQRAQIARMVEQLAEVNALMATMQRQKIPGVRSVGDPP